MLQFFIITLHSFVMITCPHKRCSGWQARQPSCLLCPQGRMVQLQRWRWCESQSSPGWKPTQHPAGRIGNVYEKILWIDMLFHKSFESDVSAALSHVCKTCAKVVQVISPIAGSREESHLTRGEARNSPTWIAPDEIDQGLNLIFF